MTSDPIGLDGVMNTYSYVKANTLILFDYNGLRGLGALLNPAVLLKNYLMMQIRH